MQTYGPGPEGRKKVITAAEKNQLDEATPLAATRLPTRIINCLERAGITTLGQLQRLNKEEFLQIENVGEYMLKECANILTEAHITHLFGSIK